jgi:hypothetical protein
MAAWYMDAMRHASTLQHPDEKRLSGGRCPDRSLRIRTDAERAHPLEICEHPSMEQRALVTDLESEHPIAERLRNQYFRALVIANPFGWAKLLATERILPSGVASTTRADA